MKLDVFKLERFFAIHEFTAKHLLSSSDCDGFSLEFVLGQASSNELKLWEQMTLGYTESAGHPLLRERIADFYQMNSIEHIVVASPGELNFAVMNILLKPEDHVVVVSPSYQSLYQIVKSIGCELSFWKPNPEDWQFNIEDLRSLIQENTKLIIINFPHNPTGSYLSPEELEGIVRIAREYDLYVFSDEMYHKLISDDMEELTPMTDLYEKGISLWGMSKTFGLAGLRIGWLVSQDKELIDKVVAYKDYLSICNNAPSEILSIIALNHYESFLFPNLIKIKSNIELFRAFADEANFVKKFISPKAGSTAFVELEIEGSALDFSNRLLEEAGIMTLPAEMFDYEGKFIRIGFGRKNFVEVLGKVREYAGKII